MTALVAALLLAQSWCIEDARVTGYVRTDYGPHGRTFDGTSILSGEPIAAASWNIPMDSVVEVEGLGRYRVADRGRLGSYGWVDIATWSRQEAFALTSVRAVCIYPPGSGAP
jgi:3D (Asp-Asp-Asp) domain-containing protein